MVSKFLLSHAVSKNWSCCNLKVFSLIDVDLYSKKYWAEIRFVVN